MKRYLVMLRKIKKGPNGSTRYKFSTKIKAIIFAAGYQAALHDCGKTNLYVSVWEVALVIHGNSHIAPVAIADSEKLKEIAEREY